MRGVRNVSSLFRKEAVGRREDEDFSEEEDPGILRGSLPKQYNNDQKGSKTKSERRLEALDGASGHSSAMRGAMTAEKLTASVMEGLDEDKSLRSTSNRQNRRASTKDDLASLVKAQNIETSAGTNRLNRILSQQTGGKRGNRGAVALDPISMSSHPAGITNKDTTAKEKVDDPKNPWTVAAFCAKHVLPPLKVQPTSIGGALLDEYPLNMQQEVLACIPCKTFEAASSVAAAATGSPVTPPVDPAALQYPNQYAAHKRKVALLTSGGAHAKGRHKLRYVLIGRSTNRPVMDVTGSALEATHGAGAINQSTNRTGEETHEKADYDTMFAQEDISESIPIEDDSTHDSAPTPDATSKSHTTPRSTPVAAPATSVLTPDIVAASPAAEGAPPAVPEGGKTEEEATKGTPGNEGNDEGGASGPMSVDIAVTGEDDDEEVSSFPVLICLSLNNDGTGPEIRKLAPLDQLTTVQNLPNNIVQLAFRNGETLRLEFMDEQVPDEGDSHHEADRPVNPAHVVSFANKRFIWTLMQIHAMLCTSVVERNTHAVAGQTEYLPPLNIRNLDRADLQYEATVNGFLKDSEPLIELLERQRAYIDHDQQAAAMHEEKVELEAMDALAYAIMMGNFHTRVSIFHSEAERKDAEEVLNSTDWTSFLAGMEDMTATGLADKLSSLLQQRMRDLEAETCRRLIAWEDEKHIASTGRTQGKTLSDDGEERDTVDALALASLFKTLDSLDKDLALMEDYLQEGAAAIKPLTDDCADIEEENRQLEQQWKSYELLGTEMKRLLKGLEMEEDSEEVLKSPASVLKYDDDGQVDLDQSEEAFETIHKAGLALHEAIEYPIQAGGMHLKAVNERAEVMVGITQGFCTSLAQIIVTIMEQIKSDVVAGSDGGKVSKNDTHSMIAKKIRDTQRKFQSSLLGYIKLIEVLAQLRPEMLPALRDAYSEMVSEGILMKKRCKGYFQALPGKNTAYLNRVGKHLKDYVPHDESIREERVNAPDIRAALNELLPVIAREAYFTSALFGPANKEQDGREKKRNFENTRAAVDKSTAHFRYYILRTCGIVSDETNDGRSTSEMAVRGDPLLSLVSSICLNEAMDSYIDREKKGGDHSLSLAYIRATILDLRKRADKQWVVWVEKQMEWIKTHDGVPLSGKRAGIFPSFARFPCYIDHVLICCREGKDDKYVPNIGQIKVINYYLQKLAATLLESLKDCAQRETTDQQYAAKVMQMENSYFFTHALKARGPAVEALFTKQITKANAICKDSTDAYLGWMIKREFATLHELFSKVSKIRKEHGDKEVPSHVPKTQFVRTLSKEASREVMKERIGSMYARMGKHLSEEGGLIPIAWKALVKVLYEWFGRWEKLSTSIYRHTLDPSAVDVVKIAKAAGGGSTKARTSSGNEFGFKSILALKNKEGGK